MSSYHVCKDSKSTLNPPCLNCVTKTCNYLRRRNASPIDSGVTVMFELSALFFNYTHEVMMIFKRQLEVHNSLLILNGQIFSVTYDDTGYS